jgi:hypothetical protein
MFSIDWPWRRDRAELADAFHAIDRFFERIGNLAFDFFDRSARQRRAHHHVRQIDGREAIDAEPHERGCADHDRAP